MAKCEVDDCPEAIHPDHADHVFCDTHWLFVPKRLVDRMFRAYQLGQVDGLVKMSQAWFDAVGEAATTIEKIAPARPKVKPPEEQPKPKAKRRKT